MLFTQNAVAVTLLRARRFLGENATALASYTDVTAAQKRLDDLIANFATQAADQSTNDRAVKGENAKQWQVRQQLSTDVMKPIAEIARRNLRNTPEFKALQMPRHATGPKFLADATGMLNAATVHKDTLLERGMPADFLEQFQTALTQLQQSTSDRDQSRTRRMGATKSLRFLEQEGRSVLKVLDALVRRALRGNVTLLGQWEGARAIYRRPGTTPTSAPTTQTSTQTSPAAPSASTPATPSVATAV